jgi:hypothetical protein
VIGRQDERGCPDLLKAIDRRRLQLFISALVVGERVQREEADHSRSLYELSSVPSGGVGPDLRRLVRLRQRLRLR